MNEQGTEADHTKADEARDTTERQEGVRRGPADDRKATAADDPGGGSDAASGAPQEELDDLAYKLLVGVRMSVRYHTRRRAWFLGWHNGTLIGIVLFAGGVTARLEPLGYSWLLTLLTGAFVALNIVFRFADTAAVHQSLAVRFRVLEQQIVPPQRLTEPDYVRLHGERLAIESEEPPPKRLLSVLCQYEVIRATRSDLGEDVTNMMARIGWCRRALSPMWSQAGFVTRQLRGIRLTA